MNKFAALTAFVNAVVEGNVEAEKAAFAEHVPQKTKEILAKINGTEGKLSESLITSIQEAMLDSGIELQNNTVFINGKKVGKIMYSGTDEFGDEAFLFFVDNNGEKTLIKDNDPSMLVNVLRKKYLNG